MGDPTTVKTDLPPVNPMDFAEEDTPKSNAEPLGVPTGMLTEDLALSGFTSPEAYKFRISGLFTLPWNISTPIGGLPFRFSFAPALQAEINALGEDTVAGVGGEVQWGLPAIGHGYVRNSALYVFDQTKFDWQLECGLRAPALFYDGPVQLGLGIAADGCLLGHTNRYFSLSFTQSY